MLFCRVGANDDEARTQLLLKQFADQREGEGDPGWRDSYADAEELVNACGCRKSSDWADLEEGERLGALFVQKWEDAVMRPAVAFCRQLRMLGVHWEPLCRALAQFEVRPPYPEDTYNILNRVIQDHYRGLLQLQVFQYWHRVVYELCLARLTPEEAAALKSTKWWYSDDAVLFFDRKAAVRRMNDVVDRYKKFQGIITGTKWKKEEAEAVLSRRRVSKPPELRDVWIFGACCGVVFTMSTILLFILFVSQAVPTYDSDVHLWGVLPYFRGFLVMYLFLWLWAAVVYSMEKNRVHYPYLLGLVGNTIGAIHIAKIAAILTSGLVSCFTLYIAAAKCNMKIIPLVPARWYIVLNALLPVSFLVFPSLMLDKSFNTRSWLLKTLLEVFCTPFIPITFASNFLTDFLTSLVRPIIDILTTLHCFLDRSIWTSTAPPDGTVFLAPLVTILPLLWRFLQCGRKTFITQTGQEAANQEAHHLVGTWKIPGTSSAVIISEGEGGQLLLMSNEDQAALEEREVGWHCKLPDSEISVSWISDGTLAMTVDKNRYVKGGYDGTKLAYKYVTPSVMIWPHGMNFLKYGMALLPIVIVMAFPEFPASVYLFLLTVSTFYSFVWDVVMDFGLWQLDTFPKRGLPKWYFGLVWRRTSLGNPEGKKMVTYYILVFCNLVGRWAWSLTFVRDFGFVGVTTRGNAELLILITSLAEATRRCVWAKLRLGHEQVADVGDYRHGDGYRNVPPLLSRQTPWTKPGGFEVLQSLKVGSAEVEEYFNQEKNSVYSKRFSKTFYNTSAGAF